MNWTLIAQYEPTEIVNDVAALPNHWLISNATVSKLYRLFALHFFAFIIL